MIGSPPHHAVALPDARFTAIIQSSKSSFAAAAALRAIGLVVASATSEAAANWTLALPLGFASFSSGASFLPTLGSAASIATACLRAVCLVVGAPHS